MINIEQHFNSTRTPKSEKLSGAEKWCSQLMALVEMVQPECDLWTFEKVPLKPFQPKYDLDQSVLPEIRTGDLECKKIEEKIKV